MTAVPLLLVIDIGNSRIKFGLSLDRHARPGQLPALLAVVAEPVESPTLPLDQLRGVVPQVLVASVNPAVLERLLNAWPPGWPVPDVIRDNSQLPIANETRHPAGVGIDRLLKAVAANEIRTAGQPMIVIDCGTATTVDWVTSAGAFAGGAILPGFRLSSQALHDHTAQLPLIDPQSFVQVQPVPIGRDTVEALNSGIYWGQIGAIRELTQRLRDTHPNESPTTLITGGAGELVAQELGLTASYHPHLTLQGLIVTARSFCG